MFLDWKNNYCETVYTNQSITPKFKESAPKSRFEELMNSGYKPYTKSPLSEKKDALGTLRTFKSSAREKN